MYDAIIGKLLHILRSIFIRIPGIPGFFEKVTIQQ